MLCRAWRNRIKGRDLYDYVFYLSMNTPVNLKHLEARLRQSNFLETEAPLGIDQLKDMLRARFATIDYDQAKQDVLPFIMDPNKLAVWSQDFFDQITQNLTKVISKFILGLDYLLASLYRNCIPCLIPRNIYQ